MYNNGSQHMGSEGDGTITPLFSGIQIEDTGNNYMSYPSTQSGGDMQGYNGGLEPGQTIKLEHGIGLMSMQHNHGPPLPDYTAQMQSHNMAHLKQQQQQQQQQQPPPIHMPLNTTPRPRKNKEEKLCGVCGDRALGYNFDAISCESCKAFFRRNAPKGLEYFKCPYDERCKMDISNRRFCKRCRLKKCFDIGMRKEYILTDDEKARKKQKIEDNRLINRKQEQHAKMTRDDIINTASSSPSDGSSTSGNPNPYIEMPPIPHMIDIKPQMSPDIMMSNSPGGVASPGSASSHTSSTSTSSNQPLIMCEQDSMEIEELLQIINEIRKHPVIWDINNRSSVYCTNKEYEKIAAKLKINVNKVRKLWKNCEQRYSLFRSNCQLDPLQHVSRRKNSVSEQEQKYFRNMKFLDDSLDIQPIDDTIFDTEIDTMLNPSEIDRKLYFGL